MKRKKIVEKRMLKPLRLTRMKSKKVMDTRMEMTMRLTRDRRNSV